MYRVGQPQSDVEREADLSAWRALGNWCMAMNRFDRPCEAPGRYIVNGKRLCKLHARIQDGEQGKT